MPGRLGARHFPRVICILLLILCYAVLSRSAVSNSETPWTVVQAPLSMEFFGQEYWSGLPCLPPGDLVNPGMEPFSSALWADCLPSGPPGKPSKYLLSAYCYYLRVLLLTVLISTSTTFEYSCDSHCTDGAAKGANTCPRLKLRQPVSHMRYSAVWRVGSPGETGRWGPCLFLHHSGPAGGGLKRRLLPRGPHAFPANAQSKDGKSPTQGLAPSLPETCKHETILDERRLESHRF